MPLHAVQTRTTTALWRAFTETFLGELGDRTGPDGYPAQAWLTHRVQHDRLYREAAARGLRCWLNPPVAFFSDLPRLFDIRQRPIGLVERQVLLDRLATKHARRPPAPRRPCPRHLRFAPASVAPWTTCSASCYPKA